jgi:hypothetical protein
VRYLLTTYHWPVLTRPQLAGFECPVTAGESSLASDIKSMKDKDDASEVAKIIKAERGCGSFSGWRQGLTPKEHWEMEDRDRLRRWQAQREDADRRARRIEFIILGVVTIAAGVVGAFVQRLLGG